jgi:hypothetical protein
MKWSRKLVYWHFVDLVWVFVFTVLSSLIFKSFIMSHEHEYVSPVKSGKFSGYYL